MKQDSLIRNGKPNKYDQAPQGTYCKTMNGLSDQYDLYQQISSNEDEPIWYLIGTYDKDN